MAPAFSSGSANSRSRGNGASARAVAPLPRLLEYAEPLLKAGATGLFLKGRDVETELTEARKRWTFRHDLIPSRSDPEGRVLKLWSLARA